MSTPPTCRIDAVIAREANQAVVFRHGPARHCQLLIWDFKTDSIVPGQWLKAKVHSHACDVSPNGRYLVIAASDHSTSSTCRAERTQNVGRYVAEYWTAISRPPYFTAIAHWFTASYGGGGGVWKSNRDLTTFGYPSSWHCTKKHSPQKVRVTPLQDGPYEMGEVSRSLLNRGWELVRAFKQVNTNPDWMENRLCHFPVWETVHTELLQKQFPQGCLQREGSLRPIWTVFDGMGAAIRVWNLKHERDLWIDVDPNGRLVFAEKGCLWAWPDFPASEPKLIADLNANVFEEVPPPDWAKKW